MLRKFIRELGMMLIANHAMFMPVMACAAEESGSVTGAVIGAPVGGLIVGVILLSMSKTKVKATKADKFVNGHLELHQQSDRYVRTDTTRTKIQKD